MLRFRLLGLLALFAVALSDESAFAQKEKEKPKPTKVVVTDPLQAHVDHLTKWTDTEMHNMTAYLASLK